jgi:hypothetical protein
LAFAFNTGAVVIYFLLRQPLMNDTAALAAAGAVPIAWTLGRLIWKRSLDPIGTAGTVSFALAALFSALFRGSSLPFKLHDAALWASVGLICLGAVALRKPLPLAQIVLPETVRTTRTRTDLERMSSTLTLIVGLTLVIRAATHVVLALTLSSGAYLVASHITGLSTLLIGGLCFVRYIRRQRRAGQADHEPPPLVPSG